LQLSLRVNYLAHTLVTRVKFVNLCSRVTKMAQAALSKLSRMANQMRKMYTWRHAAKQSL